MATSKATEAELARMVAESLTDKALADRLRRTVTSPNTFTAAERKAFVREAERRVGGLT